MAAEKLRLEQLGELVESERRRRGLSLREAAKETGVPFNTLARVEGGHLPDLAKFKRLVEWAGADVSQFFDERERVETTPEIIADHLKADPNLPADAADRISTLVAELYQTLVKPRSVTAVHLRAQSTFRPEAAKALGNLLRELDDALAKRSRE